MFTNNFQPRAIIAVGLGFKTSVPSFIPALSANFSNTVTVSKFKKIDELMKNICTTSLASGGKAGSESAAYGVCFGDGTTPPTPEDVCLSGVQHTSISSANTTKEFSYSEDDDGDLVLTAIYTIHNTSGADMTIAEVGLATSGSYYSGYNYYVPVLIERTLLDTPITIPADGAGKVTYTVRLSGLPER